MYIYIFVYLFVHSGHAWRGGSHFPLSLVSLLFCLLASLFEDFFDLCVWFTPSLPQTLTALFFISLTNRLSLAPLASFFYAVSSPNGNSSSWEQQVYWPHATSKSSLIESHGPIKRPSAVSVIPLNGQTLCNSAP